MRKIVVFLTAVLVPSALAGQTDPVERLIEVLPADVASDVVTRVEAARARDLPADALAMLALEGVAKGRSGTEVLAAVERLHADLERAREVLHGAGRPARSGEVEAAVAAMRMGVDGRAVADLAASGDGGRTMAVPLLVVAGLTHRGLPPDEALAAVQTRLATGAADRDLMEDLQPGARSRAPHPEQIGPALGGGFGGFHVPVAGITVPVGGPGGGPPGNLPGRGPHGRPSGG